MAFLCLFFCLLTLPAIAQTKEQQKTELIGKALHYALVQKQNLPTYRQVKNKKTIYVLNQMASVAYPDSAAEVLTPDMLPDLPGIKLKLISPEDLPKKHLKKKDLFYLEIGRLDVLTPEAAVVDVAGRWILGKHSRKGGLRTRQAGGYSLLFTKQNGQWSQPREIRHWDN